MPEGEIEGSEVLKKFPAINQMRLIQMYRLVVNYVLLVVQSSLNGQKESNYLIQSSKNPLLAAGNVRGSLHASFEIFFSRAHDPFPRYISIQPRECVVWPSFVINPLLSAHIVQMRHVIRTELRRSRRELK